MMQLIRPLRISLMVGLTCFGLSLVAMAENNPQLALLNNQLSPDALQPASILDLPVGDQYILIAELETGNLYVFQKANDGLLKQAAHFPITIGKAGFGKTREGDEKTPIGVYRITSELNDSQLDSFYGRRAYPLNYPNVWDRLNRFTGSGIWLHGVENDSVVRPLRDSDGCIVLRNEHLKELSRYLNVGYTKVIGVPKIDWVSADQIKHNRKTLSHEMHRWVKAWESQDTDSYLQFYSNDFSDLSMNIQQWRSYKRQVNGNKRYIRVRLSDVGIYAYPGEDNLALVEFYQNYDSNSFKSKGWKRQLWRKETDGNWRIIYEKGG